MPGRGAGHPIKFSDIVCEAVAARYSGRAIEVWFEDEIRVGQPGTLGAVWAERGSCPVAERDCRRDWAYIFGAVCPARAAGEALVMPSVNIDAMDLHLRQISGQVAPGAHATLVLDGAGWHRTGGALVVARASERYGVLS